MKAVRIVFDDIGRELVQDLRKFARNFRKEMRVFGNAYRNSKTFW